MTDDLSAQNDALRTPLPTATALLPEGDLPMVVWLRGDEPHVGDFSLDVDEVMRRLGIKRTRLTQISGRELRVARIRRGRYIAPVYRPIDVEAYAAWTRPTASHLKSSQALEDAAERVFEGVEHLLSTELGQLRRDVVAERRGARADKDDLRRDVADYNDRAERRGEAFLARLAESERALETLTREVSKLVFVNQSLNREFLEFGASLRIILERQKEHEARILAAVTPPPAAPEPTRKPRKAPLVRIPKALQRTVAETPGDKQKVTFRRRARRPGQSRK